MKWLSFFVFFLFSLSVFAQNKAAPQQTPFNPQQAQPSPGLGPRPPGPPVDFENMKKQEVARLEKRMSIMEAAKSCIDEAKDGRAFGDCMRTMGETMKAEDQKFSAEMEKRREEAEKRGFIQPQNYRPTKFRIEDAPKVAPKIKMEKIRPEVKKR